MRDKESVSLTVKHLDDYQPFPWNIEGCALDFLLDFETTKITSVLRCVAKESPVQDLVLDGEDVQLIEVKIDDQVLGADQWQLTASSLTIPVSVIANRQSFSLTTSVEIHPSANKALEGLYQSSSILCTQCEAEGFRRITFYPDRPDVMTKFQVRLQGDKTRFPLLLSNGNLVGRGNVGDDHYTVWDDPFSKPCYLFALVAGDLETLEDSFTTMGGRKVSLQIHAEAHNIDKCDHAMLALKKSMAWDEVTYGREYDLDLFQIVAVDDFNSGAMENKSLNIFNSECILASQETTVDSDYETIEAIVAHEYFHNWSGNRVTLRDWFQLSLKEGLTVFRDGHFTADHRSASIKRINDAWLIRSAQFAEDASPIAHPVRPSSYTEIRNFYTLTVYEKGAEVIGMLATLLGWQTFRQGTDVYFSRHDGQAVRVEEFLKAMEDVSGRCLQQFMLWYSQSGTPDVHVSDSYDSVEKKYSITLRQSLASTTDQAEKKPMLIPVALSFLSQQGEMMPFNSDGETEYILELDSAESTFTFALDHAPIPSLFRRFSAPVRVHYDYSQEQLELLLDRDTDAYSKWNAGQQLKTNIANELIAHVIAGKTFDTLSEPIQQCLENLVQVYIRLIESVLVAGVDSESRSMVAELLVLPGRSWLDNQQKIIHVAEIDRVVRYLHSYLASQLIEHWRKLYHSHCVEQPFQPSFDQASMRQLKNLALMYLVEAGEQGQEIAWQQFQQADNMTDRRAAVHNLVNAHPALYGEQALQQLYSQWQHEPLVVNQWLELQSGIIGPDTLTRVDALRSHPAFDIKNPNKVRSLIGFYANRSYTGFHRTDGVGYAWFTDRLLELDSFNSQVAARLATPLSRWRRYQPCYGLLMKQNLEILQQSDISRDLREVVEKSLQAVANEE